MQDLYAVVLAAGKGTRMKSDLAKVLHPLGGKPLLRHVLEALAPLEPAKTVVVVGHQAGDVAAISVGAGVTTALQAEQLGTGHAVDMARPELEGHDGVTLVLCGDVPLLRTSTIRDLVATTREKNAAATVLTAIAEDPTGYGRIVRDGDGRVRAIVEHKDATDEQRTIREYNTGTWCFDNGHLWSVLSRLDRDNAQGEYYLTDVVELLVGDGEVVAASVCEDEREVQGVNTVDDLERARRDREAMGDERA
ncbi:MAG TPA: NTP transferase domain-containing protein [Candidatus Krumholzibacteria bacterium]|nr:NTP transferase domain-containing protein [Candidatus Krumholzibacteria bacterium]